MIVDDIDIVIERHGMRRHGMGRHGMVWLEEAYTFLT